MGEPARRPQQPPLQSDLLYGLTMLEAARQHLSRLAKPAAALPEVGEHNAHPRGIVRLSADQQTLDSGAQVIVIHRQSIQPIRLVRTVLRSLRLVGKRKVVICMTAYQRLALVRTEALGSELPQRLQHPEPY